MFTGLIEELGSFVSNNGDRYRFAAKEVIQGTEIDDSKVLRAMVVNNTVSQRTEQTHSRHGETPLKSET